MVQKEFLRKKYFIKRKKNYFAIKENFFNPLIKLLKKKFKKKISIALYYPTAYELNVLGIFDKESSKKFRFLLPVIDEKNSMNFYDWKKGDILMVNRYGILEPTKTKLKVPEVILVPLLAYDKNNNRLGYGKGFYDRYLNKLKNKANKILTIGIAFSFQKHHNLPNNNKDYKLDYILTEKGLNN
tara:strand:+ start:387 stop:938 length:552 start_codon:yes stop_codon:yes gene_type:complete